MASIRITRFAGLLPQVNPKELANDHAQVAHNCLLWDGWLHPMPQWKPIINLSNTPAGLYKNPTVNSLAAVAGQPLGFSSDYYFANAVMTIGEPFNSAYISGIFKRAPAGNTYLGHYIPGGTTNNPKIVYLGAPAPNVMSYNFNISKGNASVYPISRTYAITAVCFNQEGPPTVFEQLTKDQYGNFICEGDGITLNATIDRAQILQYGITSINVYRSIPGFDTAEQLGNPLETGFHFIGNVGVASSSFSFYDAGNSSEIQGDLLISDQWIPPPSDPNKSAIFFGQTEGGWNVLARYDSSSGVFGSALGAPCVIQFSERYMNHAWPMQNTISLPEAVTGVAVYYDDIFIGTQNTSYHIRVEAGETEVLNMQVRRFANEYACIPNTMVTTNFGAMYASVDGLIALTSDDDRVTSKSVASPGDDLIVPFPIFNSFIGLKLSDAKHAAWWNGNYFGFVNNGNSQINGYILNQPSPSNQEFPLGQLVTIDIPHGNFVDSVTTGKGLFIAFDNVIYTFPLPGYGYDSSPLAPYTWLSKRYVMPGLTTFAGMKIVNDNSGALTVTLYGYRTSGQGPGRIGNPDFIFTRQVGHSKPFRIPHQHKCLEWEIKLEGKAVVEEVHLSTSYQDLIEEATNASAIA
jgi:hypothetical protein